MNARVHGSHSFNSQVHSCGRRVIEVICMDPISQTLQDIVREVNWLHSCQIESHEQFLHGVSYLSGVRRHDFSEERLVHLPDVNRQEGLRKEEPLDVFLFDGNLLDRRLSRRFSGRLSGKLSGRLVRGNVRHLRLWPPDRLLFGKSLLLQDDLWFLIFKVILVKVRILFIDGHRRRGKWRRLLNVLLFWLWLWISRKLRFLLLFATK
mmetsp:Transcript_17437/g.16636  ORF Transcript_17437/g.16636 Transcript_17437/m.16636 type:complete len:207 (-) Transcript_17437:13-633(-)